MSVESIWVKCHWCEEEQTFNGEDPEKEWREAGWLIHLSDEGEHEFCSLSCAIASL